MRGRDGVTTERGTVRPFRPLVVFAATVAWLGVLLQFYLSLKLALGNGKSVAEGLVIYFGYFTILTNILVALVLTMPLVAPASSAGRFAARPGVGTATAAAITVVGLVYVLVLRHVWNPQGWQLVADSVLHYATPALFLVHWWIGVPKHALRRPHIAAWASYPITYLVYILIRGELTGLYPYPFLDVTALGYGRAAANTLGMLVLFTLVSLGLLAAAHLQRGAPGSASVR